MTVYFVMVFSASGEYISQYMATHYDTDSGILRVWNGKKLVCWWDLEKYTFRVDEETIDYED